MNNCLLVLTTIIPYWKPDFPTCKDKTKSLLPQISSSFFCTFFFQFSSLLSRTSWNSPFSPVWTHWKTTTYRLRMYWSFPLIALNCPFDCTDSVLWFNWNAEPSTIIWRTFAIATPKARYRNAEPSATSWIQRKGSVNPQMRFWKSTKELQKIP